MLIDRSYFLPSSIGVDISPYKNYATVVKSALICKRHLFKRKAVIPLQIASISLYCTPILRNKVVCTKETLGHAAEPISALGAAWRSYPCVIATLSVLLQRAASAYG